MLSAYSIYSTVFGDNMQKIRVEVAYATANEQILLCVEMPAGSRIIDAVECSGLLRRRPDIKWPDAPVGVFGQKISKDALLADGDRVEIYRPLRVDPKTRRRERASN